MALELASCSAGHANPVVTWQPYAREASLRFRVPLVWVERVIRTESGGRTSLRGRPIRSSAGAMGLMQLMPGTWDDMRVRLGLGSAPDDPRDNILAGTYYLRLMYQRFGYPGMFAAYNAGPRRYEEHLIGRGPLPAETQRYLTQIVRPVDQPGAKSTPPVRRSVFAISGGELEPKSVAPTPFAPASSGANLFALRKGP